MASTSAENLTTYMKEKFRLLNAECLKKNINILLTCTSRDIKEQVALYAQGRQSLTEVNALRKVVKLAPITAKENKYCVTWTLKSKHLVNFDNSDPTDDKSKAFDIVVLDAKKKITWNIKADVNKNNISDYVEVGKIGISLGLVWGGSWKNTPDYYHFEQPAKIS